VPAVSGVFCSATIAYLYAGDVARLNLHTGDLQLHVRRGEARCHGALIAGQRLRILFGVIGDVGAHIGIAADFGRRRLGVGDQRVERTRKHRGIALVAELVRFELQAIGLGDITLVLGLGGAFDQRDIGFRRGEVLGGQRRRRRGGSNPDRLADHEAALGLFLLLGRGRRGHREAAGAGDQDCGQRGSGKFHHERTLLLAVRGTLVVAVAVTCVGNGSSDSVAGWRMAPCG
jgi:hypothetical protein